MSNDVDDGRCAAPLSVAGSTRALSRCSLVRGWLLVHSLKPARAPGQPLYPGPARHVSRANEVHSSRPSPHPVSSVKRTAATDARTRTKAIEANPGRHEARQPQHAGGCWGHGPQAGPPLDSTKYHTTAHSLAHLEL